jgi:preprotein translocase subunit YajC
VPTEFYLIIFLLVAMLVFTYFYSERAQARRAVKHQAKDDEARADAIEA